MDNILLCSNHIPLVTSIHNTFIEKYMLGANGSYVKVYLYLSKCIQSGQEDLSISSLADQMENTEKDVLRALNYWEKKGLLAIERSEDKSVILGIDVLNPDELPDTKQYSKKTVPEPAGAAPAFAQDPDGTKEEPVPDEPDTITDSSRKTVSRSSRPAKKPAPSEDLRTEKKHSFCVNAQQVKRLKDDRDFNWTCNVVESFLGRPMSSKELQMLSYIYDELHFSPELIVYLYEHCTSQGKTSPNYIQAVALEWDKNGIRTPDEAQNASAAYHASYTAVSKSFALGRALAKAERSFVDRWQNDWQMDLSVICEACDRTMIKLQHADFKYTEGILEKWHRADIHTLQGVQEADALFAQKKAEKKQTAPATVSTLPRNGRSKIVQHGLSKDEADELEKKLLRNHP